MSPQTKSLTIAMHQISINLSCPCKRQKTLRLQHSSRHFFNTIYSVAVPTCTTTVFQKHLWIFSVEAKKPETVLIWRQEQCGFFSYVNLSLLECLQVSITEIMSFAFLKAKKLLFLFKFLFCLYKSRQSRSGNRSSMSFILLK